YVRHGAAASRPPLRPTLAACESSPASGAARRSSRRRDATRDRRQTACARTRSTSSGPSTTRRCSTSTRARARSASKRCRAAPRQAVRARMITAICPGSYDPVTNGHIDVITRASGIFDRVVVGVVGNPHHKQPMFPLDERVGFLREALADLWNVEVDVFSELVVDFARRWNA